MIYHFSHSRGRISLISPMCDPKENILNHTINYIKKLQNLIDDHDVAMSCGEFNGDGNSGDVSGCSDTSDKINLSATELVKIRYQMDQQNSAFSVVEATQMDKVLYKRNASASGNCSDVDGVRVVSNAECLGGQAEDLFVDMVS